MTRLATITRALAVASIVAVAGLAAAGSQAAQGGELGLQLLGNFDKPDYVAQPPGSKGLAFVVEKPGTIRVLRDGRKVGHPFLDIRARVETPGEDGLSSMAFDPHYRHNRRFYVFYTRNDGGDEVDVFKRSGSSPTRANKASRRQVGLIPHPNMDMGQHNGGQLEFGPDGHLYVSSGDGACCGDPLDTARKLNTPLGKILRIDPRPHGGYTVPKGNPRVGKPGLDEIFSWGLRNPWRFSFDRKTGRIAIADVGQASVEEIDYDSLNGAKGANFGWPFFEGDRIYDAGRPLAPGNLIFPIHTYTHPDGCAVIGGYVVRDPSLPSLYGRYVYSDLCNGDIRSLVPHLGGATDDQSTALHVDSPSSFGEGYRGRIYVASIDGPVYRLTQSP